VEINGTVGFDSRDQTSISSRVSGRIEKLFIRYNYQPVRKGQLIMEIYSPDLAAAQRELIFIVNTADPDMIRKAKQRLQLLGMRTPEINNVIRTGDIFYKVPVYSSSDGYILEKSATNFSPSVPATASPGDGMAGMSGGGTAISPNKPVVASTGSAPVMLREGQYVAAGQPLFAIYQSRKVTADFALDQQIALAVRPGQKLLIYPNGNKSEMQVANIGLIEPVFRNGQYFTIARVYLDNKQFQVGELLTANIPVVYKEGWWLPRKAVWRLGSKSIVYKKEENGFRPVEVTTGVEIKGMVQVMTAISDWKIASNAYYLADSESFINVNDNMNK
jgi:hypothetical protein